MVSFTAAPGNTQPCCLNTPLSGDSLSPGTRRLGLQRNPEKRCSSLAVPDWAMPCPLLYRHRKGTASDPCTEGTVESSPGLLGHLGQPESSVPFPSLGTAGCCTDMGPERGRGAPGPQVPYNKAGRAQGHSGAQMGPHQYRPAWPCLLALTPCPYILGLEDRGAGLEAAMLGSQVLPARETGCFQDVKGRGQAPRPMGSVSTSCQVH